MSDFGLFFRPAIFNLTFSHLPTFPPCEKNAKINTNYFQNSKKIATKFKLKHKYIRHKLPNPSASERILSPYGKEIKELRCFKD